MRMVKVSPVPQLPAKSASSYTKQTAWGRAQTADTKQCCYWSPRWIDSGSVTTMEQSFLSALHGHKVSRSKPKPGVAAWANQGVVRLGLFRWWFIWIHLQESRSVESLFGHGSDPLYYMKGEEAGGVMEYLTGADATQILQGSNLYVGQLPALFCLFCFITLTRE